MKRREKLTILLSIRDLCESVVNGDLPSSEDFPLRLLASLLTDDDKKEFSAIIDDLRVKEAFDIICKTPANNRRKPLDI